MNSQLNKCKIVSVQDSIFCCKLYIQHISIMPIFVFFKSVNAFIHNPKSNPSKDPNCTSSKCLFC